MIFKMKHTIGLLLLVVCHSTFGQVLYNNGAQIYTATGAVVQVSGTAQNNTGTFDNNGTTTIDINYINNGITQGNGIYQVAGDWDNNLTFTSGTSQVILNGGNQSITGSAITTFNILELLGTGIKTQTINSRIGTSGTLILNDRELATDAFSMFVDNTSSISITRTTGFVSSDPTSGRLDRATNSTGTYLFPTGSSIGTLRYRPIEISPSSTSPTRYEVRFANVLATTESYDITQTDTAICSVNLNWFHLINRSSGTSDGDISIYYDQGTDGVWSGIAQWNSTPTEWQSVGIVVPGIPPPLESLTKNAWSDWTDIPYVLTVPNPIFDVSGVDATTCNLNDGQLIFSSLNPSTSYTVTYDSSGVSIGPITVNTNGLGQVTITTGAGIYTNITVSDGTCNHVSSATITITEPASPTPTITGTLNYCTGFNTTLSTGAYSTYLWTTLATTQTTTATIADNPITVTVTDANGCVGTSPAVNTIEDNNPDPGTNGATAFCPTDASVDLFTYLGGLPDAGGIWSPALTSGTGVFNPSVDIGGTYTYILNACGGGTLTADVVVTMNPAPNAGANGTLSICPSDPSTDLFAQLTGTPDAGGSWSPALNSGTGVFDPGADAAGTYIYSVTNGCGTITADVIVTITTSPDPGINGTAIFCPSDASTDLFGFLTGTPDVGGTWSPALNSGTGVFDPALDLGGTYTYTLNACGGGTLTSTVIVTLTPSPNSGTNGTLILCSSDTSTDLFTELGGTPDVGGSWSPLLASGTGIFDPAVDVSGTYTYSVTNSCGTSTTTVIVTVNPCSLPVAGFTFTNSICEGDCISITDQSTNGTAWLWTFTGATPSSSSSQNPGVICYNTSGTYDIQLIVNNSFGADTLIQSITVNSLPTVDAGDDQTIDLGTSAILDATGSSGNYFWAPATDVDCITCASTTATPTEDITYNVTITDANGCSASDSISITLNFLDAIGVPDAFSPNGDNNNDFLLVKGGGIESLTFVVFNRYGEKVFETTDQTNGWDGSYKGKSENTGVFAYYLEYVLINGDTGMIKGNVTLIR